MPNYCEAQWDGCINMFLSPAHSRKRRFIDTKELYFAIAWLCQNCHRMADEVMTHDVMEMEINKIIARRNA